MRSSFVIIALLVTLGYSESIPERFYTETQFWFDSQLVDHSDPSNTATWSQRYWVSSNFYNPETGSVLLYICGEGTCGGVPKSKTFMIELAQRYNSIILVLEHRYYGISMPFGEDSFQLENLKFLNVHQALDDLANFINWVKSNNKFGVGLKNPWYTIGGSYPGALSAWFRYKYPHLTVAALASSAVVMAKADFPEFDEQIYASTQKNNDECTSTIQKLTQRAEEILQDESISMNFKKSFKSEHLNEGEFLFMFADHFVELVQYGKRSWMCEQLKGKTLEEGLAWAAEYVTDHVSINQYGSYHVRNTTYEPENDGARQWTYQYCSEVGWLQTAPKDTSKSMRSQKLTIDFYKQFCKDSFGVDLWPNTDVFNAYFGGEDLNVPGLIMTNGDEDPWKHASVTKGNPLQKQVVIEIICDNCAHCVDLKTPSDSDSDALKQARSRIMENFDLWIGRHWTSINNKSLIVVQ